MEIRKTYRLLEVPVVVALMAILTAPATSFGQDEEGLSEYEYEPYEGLHEEEWYDPSDWFTYEGYGVNYEDNWYYDDYNYGDPYLYDDYYGYDDTYYGDDYYWDEDETWAYDADPYAYDDFGDDELDGDWDHGWHYDYMTDAYAQDRERQRQEQRTQADRRDRRDRQRHDRQRQARDTRQRDQRSGPVFWRTEAKVQDFRSIDVEGEDESHRIAKLQLRNGDTISADLGTRDQLRDIRLQKGDRIRIVGSEGRMNDKKMLIAHAVGKHGQWTQIDRPKQKLVKSFKGTIRGTQTTSFEGFDQDHVVALVKLDRGPTLEVDLGPKEKVRNLDINMNRGTEIQFKARAGRIDGKPALIATRVNPDQAERYQVSMQRGHFSRGDQRDWRQRGDRGQQRTQQGQRDGRSKFVRTEGQIQEMNKRQIEDSSHVFATIKSKQGQSTTIDLGPKQKVSDLNLSQDDEIHVVGRKARLRDQQVIRAGAISHDGRWHELQREQLPKRQFSGKLLSTRTHRGHTIATVRLNEGKKARVVLGPSDKMDRIDLSKGDRLRFTARPGAIKGKAGLIASNVRSGDQEPN
jgi:hypothetical protein